MTPRGDIPSGSSARHEGSSQLVNCERWLASMDHGVTVGAHGSQVLDRIQRVGFSVGADRDEVFLDQDLRDIVATRTARSP